MVRMRHADDAKDARPARGSMKRAPDDPTFEEWADNADRESMAASFQADRSTTRDPIRAFLRIYGAKPFRGQEECAPVIREYREGGKAARERALRRIMAGTSLLVVMVFKKWQFAGASPDDLLQAGMVGALRALDTYDPEEGAWSTYVMWWIRHGISRTIENEGSQDSGRIPSYMLERMKFLRKRQAQFITTHDHYPTAEELHRAIAEDDLKTVMAGLTLEQIKGALELMYQLASGFAIDAPLPMDEKGNSGERGRLDVSSKPGQEIGFGAREAYEKKRDVFLRLFCEIRPSGGAILCLRLGVGVGLLRPLTLLEIAKCIHLTRERVRQIESSAYKRFHDALGWKREEVKRILLTIDDVGELPAGYDPFVVLLKSRKLPPVPLVTVMITLDAERKVRREELRLRCRQAAITNRLGRPNSAEDEDEEELSEEEEGEEEENEELEGERPNEAPSTPVRVSLPTDVQAFVKLLLLAPNTTTRWRLLTDLLLVQPRLASTVLKTPPERWKAIQVEMRSVAEEVVRSWSR